MHGAQRMTAIIEREDDGFVALCPELDIASQGRTPRTALRNLQEAVELFLAHADPREVRTRLKSSLGIRRFKAANG